MTTEPTDPRAPRRSSNDPDGPPILTISPSAVGQNLEASAGAGEEPRVIMLLGQAGSGKGTAAGEIVKHLLYRGFTPQVRDFATPLRHVLCRVFGLTWEQTVDRRVKEKPIDRWPYLSPRELMQIVGTDCFRARWPDVWVQAWLREARIVLAAPKGVVICTDCRFPNEVEAARALGGAVVVRVYRSGPSITPHAAHASEQHYDDIVPDWILTNTDGEIGAFREDVAAMASHLYAGGRS